MKSEKNTYLAKIFYDYFILHSQLEVNSPYSSDIYNVKNIVARNDIDFDVRELDVENRIEVIDKVKSLLGQKISLEIERSEMRGQEFNVFFSYDALDIFYVKRSYIGKKVTFEIGLNERLKPTILSIKDELNPQYNQNELIVLNE